MCRWRLNGSFSQLLNTQTMFVFNTIEGVTKYHFNGNNLKERFKNRFHLNFALLE